MSDKELMQYYRVEFYKEWFAAQNSGVEPSIKNIRKRLGIEKQPKKMFGLFG